MQSKVKICLFSARDHVDAVVRLLDTSLGNVAEREFLIWKHVMNPFGASYGLLAFLDERLVGSRFFMRWRFSNGEQKVEALRPVDTVTHPEYRGQGIFKQLNLEGVERFGKDRIMFNTPNVNSLRGNLRLGWKQCPGELFYHYRLTSLFKHELGKPKIKLSQHCPNHLPVQCHYPGTFTTDRTPEFIRWRYARSRYQFATLGSESRAVLVYDIEYKGPISILRVMDGIGTSIDQEILINATAKMKKAQVIRSVSSTPLSIQHGSTLVVTRGINGLNPADLNLDFSAGDLQSVL